MNYPTIVISILALALAVTGCENGDHQDEYLIPQSSLLRLGEHADTQEFEIRSTQPWKVTGTTDWCTVSSPEGSSTKIIEISATLNNSSRERSTVLVFSSKSGSAEVTVTQYGSSDITDIFECERFRSICLNRFDTNRDGRLMSYEVSGETLLTLQNAGITSLKGIEFFRNLAMLNVQFNSLEQADFSGNARLSMLDCSNNNFNTTLDMAGCDNLHTLICYNNPVIRLALQENPRLEKIDCHNTSIFSLDVSSNKKLRELDCSDCDDLYEIIVWSGFNLEGMSVKKPASTKFNVRK